MEVPSATMTCRLPAGTILINHFGPSLTGVGGTATGAVVAFRTIGVIDRDSDGDGDGDGDSDGDRDRDRDGERDAAFATTVGDGPSEEAPCTAGATAPVIRCPPDEPVPTSNTPTNQTAVNIRRTIGKPSQPGPLNERWKSVR
jgi:hypothetical protein